MFRLSSSNIRYALLRIRPFAHACISASTVCTNFMPPERKNEDMRAKRNRLLYESRKRGNLENGILLSTFADKYLAEMSKEQLDEYDKLINIPDNDWDIYYWAVGNRDPPAEFQTETLKKLKNHSKNLGRELRNQQPSVQSFKK